MIVDISSVADYADNPLQFALRLVSATHERDRRYGLLLQALSQYGQHCDEATAQQIMRLAGSLHAEEPQQTQQTLGTLSQNPNTASAWMRAALLEAAGRHAEAFGAFNILPDTDWGELRAVRQLACARNSIKAGNPSGAWKALREAAKVTNSYRTLCAVDRLLGRLGRHEEVFYKRQCKLALIGSTTLDFLVPALRARCFATGIDANIYLGSFNQYQQEVLDPNSGLATFLPDVIIVATDWRALGLRDENPVAAVQEKVRLLRNLWHECRERLGAFVIQHNFEIPTIDPYGRLSATLEGGRGRLLREINLALWEAEQEEAGVAILDVEQVAADYGKVAWSDPVLWHTAKQYPTSDAIPLLVRHQVALLQATLGLGSKCLVLDLDGTLWGGVVGEDDLSGIELGGSAAGEAFVEFQRYVQSLQRRGIMLAVCSKNNEQDAKLPFLEHPEMVLSLDDITLFVANWQPKEENLRFIAETINIGLDSLVLVDDNPAERSRIRHQLPEVEVPEMPVDPALYVQTLDQQMYFEALSLTQDDRQRVESYRANVKRKVVEQTSTSVEEFLASLGMKVELKPFDEPNLPRIAQLINKTNQFNLTTRRLSESQVRSLLDRSDCYTQAMRLRDRFGDSGLTGILVAFEEGQSLRIDNWLMSCRVLGRRVEEVMFGSLVSYAQNLGARYLIGEYIPTAKNEQASDFFDRLGFERIEAGSSGGRWYQYDLFHGTFTMPDCFEIEDYTQ